MNGFSDVLLIIAWVAFIVLCALTATRLLVFRARVVADISDPGRTFAFFTFVAACNVLALRMYLAAHPNVGIVLATLGAVAWLVLGYAIPGRLITLQPKRPSASSVNGSWLVWVVGTQSVAAAIAVVSPAPAESTNIYALLAVAIWGVGVLLYVLLMAIILARLLLVELPVDQITPPYWIIMGATAITVLTSSRILGMPGGLPISRATIQAVGFIMWGFGSWWLPLLILLGVWRHILQRLPISYDPNLWSMVFPLGMYAAASYAFGRIADLPFLQQVAGWEVWLGLGAWVGTFAAMVWRWIGSGVEEVGHANR